MYAEILRKLRRNKGLSQKQLADLLHVSNGTVAMWETQKRTPDKNMLITIANFFDVSVDELLGNNLKKIELSVYTNAQQNLIDKVKYLNDDQCLTLCSIIETFGNDNKQILSDYKQLKKYED